MNLSAIALPGHDIALSARLSGIDRMGDLMARAERNVALSTTLSGFNRMANLMAKAERELTLAAQFAGLDRVAELMAKAHVDIGASTRSAQIPSIVTLPRHVVESVWFPSVSTMANVAAAETPLALPLAQPPGARPGTARRRIQRSHLAAQSVNARRGVGAVENQSRRAFPVLQESLNRASENDHSILTSLEQLKEARRANQNSRYSLYLTLSALAYAIIIDARDNPEKFIAYANFLNNLFRALGQQLGYGPSEIMPIEFYDL